MEHNFQYADTAPYPKIEVSGQNRAYARAMLSNIGSCDSEMSSVSLYFYNSVITEEYGGNIAECFHKISMVEMHHLDIFAKLSYLLGADPRLWIPGKRGPIYWSPACRQYPKKLPELLEYAISGERKTIEQYRQQALWIKDDCICAMLERIIKDEELHIKIFHELYMEFCDFPY